MLASIEGRNYHRFVGNTVTHLPALAYRLLIVYYLPLLFNEDMSRLHSYFRIPILGER